MSSLELTYNSFKNRISDVNKKDILFKLTKSFLFAAMVFIAFALILILSEAFFGFSPVIRKMFFFGYISAFASTVIISLAIAYIKFKDSKNSRQVTTYAKRVGTHYPEIKDNLINAIQIYDYTKKKTHIFSNDLISESINQINEATKPYDFKKIISFKKINAVALLTGASILIFTFLLTVFPSLLEASNRIINYNFTFVENTLGIAYEVSPGNIEITKGSSVEINAKVLFNDPNYSTDKISLSTKNITGDGIEISSSNEDVSAAGKNEFKA
ncbi:MAG TPA: hypothetical protein VGK25_04460, partial [Ignavibacteria bacterium]